MNSIELLFLIGFIIVIQAAIVIIVYRRGLKDKTLLPSAKDITAAVVALVEDSLKSTTYKFNDEENDEEKKRPKGRYKS